MSSDNIVISARGLSKAFAIYRRAEDRLWQILFRNRRRFYQEFVALQGVDIDIRRGETVGVIGRNGSGKSTFLHLVCGTLQPSGGSITVNGRVAALLELGAGFNPEFTGVENIYLSASILGLDRQTIDARLDDIKAFADIGDFIERPVKTYSSGMYARLAFAVAAHVDADILIVDEILAVGDAAFGQKCMRFIRKFKERGTLLFVSHDAASVVNLCDKVVWLDKGVVRGVGPAKAMTRRYLASLYELDEQAGEQPVNEAPPAKDHRFEELSASTLRNDIKIFDFNPATTWFGERGATIEKVRLVDLDGRPFALLQGGEMARIEVHARADAPLTRPIVGFLVNDRLGQPLFGDNTFLTYRLDPVPVGLGERLIARFEFQMPFLPTGDYSVTAAIAEGDPENHRQHHWLHEALILHVKSSHVARGLVGIPMRSISIIAQQEAQHPVDVASGRGV